MESGWSTVQQPEEIVPYIDIRQNEFLGGKHQKLKEEDITICECKYNAFNPESACGEFCLNVQTSTECTPGYCPCVEHCKNQKFQKCEYAMTKLFKTEGRGWGLLADENIKAGQFVIEYCGEVISSEESTKRSHTYEAQGLKDFYIISLNANYFIDATRKGSLARFINHSCQPNCETRKWTVLGETRVGIFAKKDISIGTELAYDYNFEWYGGAAVRCLCGSVNCSLFLGAKSQGFQEYNHLWEEGDARYTVENIPLYDSAEDEPFRYTSYSLTVENNEGSKSKLEATNGAESSSLAGTQSVAVKSVQIDAEKEPEVREEGKNQVSSQKCPMKSSVRNNSASSKKRTQHNPRQKAKASGRKNVSSKPVGELFTSKEVREEIRKCEELKSKAASDLNSVYDEIRPAVERAGDRQDSVPINLAEKWIHATFAKYKADFMYDFSIIKNAVCTPKANDEESSKPSEGEH